MPSLLQRCSKSILSLSSPRPQCVCSQQAQLFSSTCSKRVYTHALQCIVLYSTPHPQANLCTNVYRPHQSTAWSPWCMDSQQASLFSDRAQLCADPSKPSIHTANSSIGMCPGIQTVHSEEHPSIHIVSSGQVSRYRVRTGVFRTAFSPGVGSSKTPSLPPPFVTKHNGLPQ